MFYNNSNRINIFSVNGQRRIGNLKLYEGIEWFEIYSYARFNIGLYNNNNNNNKNNNNCIV